MNYFILMQPVATPEADCNFLLTPNDVNGGRLTCTGNNTVFCLSGVKSLELNTSEMDDQIAHVEERQNNAALTDTFGVGDDNLLTIASEAVQSASAKANAKKDECKVCGDVATGMYFGARVCVPCKTFFLRYAVDDVSFVCRKSQDCVVTCKTRTQCKFCRYQKCLQVGMYRKVRPTHVEIIDGQVLCAVCGDVGNGIHFGAVTCEGCKKFFRRGLQEYRTYACTAKGTLVNNCAINPRTRNTCRYCRFQKCLKAGMSREAIQMGRPAKSKKHYNSNTSLPPVSASSETDDHVQMTSSSLDHWQWTSTTATTTAAADSSSTDYDEHLQVEAVAISASAESSALQYTLQPLLQQQPSIVTLTGGHRPASTICRKRSRDSGMTSSTTMTSTSTFDRRTIRQVAKSCVRKDSGFAEEDDDDECQPDSTDDTENDSSTKDRKLSESALTQRRLSSDSLTVHHYQTDESNSMLTDEGCVVQNNCVGDAVNFWIDKTVVGGILVDERLLDSCSSTLVGELPQQLLLLERETDGSNSELKHTQRCFMVDNDNLLSPTSSGSSNSISRKSPPRHDGHVTGRGNLTSSALSATTVKSRILNRLKRNDLVTDVKVASLPEKSAEHLMTQSGRLEGGNQLYCNSLESPAGVWTAVRGSPTATRSAIRSSSSGDCRDTSNLRQCPATEFLCKQRLQNDQQQLSENADAVVDKGEGQCSPLNLTELMEISTDYWLNLKLPDENLMFGNNHWNTINRIIPVYNQFVNLGEKLNRTLSSDFEKWRMNNDAKLLPKWIEMKVIPAYTLLSVAYCQALPGFSSLDTEDQATLIRLGQSSSRIMVAALHWFDADNRVFRNFLSWRSGFNRNRANNNSPLATTSSTDSGTVSAVDLFKQQLINFADSVVEIQIDQIEAAIVNVLLIMATDFPNLKRASFINDQRNKILHTFRAYTTAKYGNPNNRLEVIFSILPEVRRLGLLHYLMTTTQTMTAEEVAKSQPVNSGVTRGLHRST